MDGDWLREALGAMTALETQLQDSLARLATETGSLLETPAIVGRLHSLVTGQRQALESHLEGLAGADTFPVPAGISALLGSPLELGEGGDTVARLGAVAAVFAQTAYRHAVLHGVAHRAYQVATADLADQHRVSHLGAAQAIHQCLGDVLVDELQMAGLTCRCQCPSCGPGICLCWHAHVEAGATGPGVSRDGIVVREPRAGSNAVLAGLGRGDVILAVEGQGIGSYQDMLDRMREHEPGDRVELTVRRGTGELEQVILTR